MLAEATGTHNGDSWNVDFSEPLLMPILFTDTRIKRIGKLPCPPAPKAIPTLDLIEIADSV